MSFQGRELLGDTDGDGVSMAANGGLTDAEGALSDVNSIYECGGGEAGDLDDTSLSSRASSRFFALTICFSAKLIFFFSEYLTLTKSTRLIRCTGCMTGGAAFLQAILNFNYYECIQMCFF